VRLLLEKGAAVAAKNNNSDTALHLAANGRHEAVVRLLLKAKVDVNMKSNKEGTALHFAASSRHEAVLRLRSRMVVRVEEGSRARRRKGLRVWVSFPTISPLMNRNEKRDTNFFLAASSWQI
jgi:hypothetical protein